DAWRYWIRERASDEWMRAYYSESPRPWSNPRLSTAESYVIRYAHDSQFRAREYKRHLEKKRRHRQQISNTRSLTLRREREIRASATHCVYCGCMLDASNRTLDHVEALSRGGEHSEA